MRGIASQRPEVHEIDDNLWDYYGATYETKQRSSMRLAFEFLIDGLELVSNPQMFWAIKG
jgi:hypothetical protein